MSVRVANLILGFEIVRLAKRYERRCRPKRIFVVRHGEVSLLNMCLNLFFNNGWEDGGKIFIFCRVKGTWTNPCLSASRTTSTLSLTREDSKQEMQ
eukprot:758224-Hanusia_phi.AAC.1